MESINENILLDRWSHGTPINVNGKDYRVVKMSYGAFALEPYSEEEPHGGGEHEPFLPGTIWLKKRHQVREWEIDELMSDEKKLELLDQPQQ
jgi:hypothetical protein